MWWNTDDDYDRFSRALGRSHQVSTRIEVWSTTGMLADAAMWIDGSVTDEWVTGMRRTMSLTVPPTRRWMGWFANEARLEIRPFRGIRFSPALTIECPMGRFPVLPPERAVPAEEIKINAHDYWDFVKFSDFVGAAGSATGLIVDQLARLIRDARLPEPIVATADRTTTPGVIFERTRHDAIEELATAIAAECYIDRLGRPVIAPLRLQTDATSEALTGSGNTVTGIQVDPNWDDVYNVVTAASTANDVDFPTQAAYIEWIDHPAHPNQVGWLKTLKITSPTLRDADQALDAARAKLVKVCAPASTVTYKCVPDPRRDASDSILGTTLDRDSVTTQIQKVTTPFKAGDDQTVETVTTRLWPLL